jgi:hypothetical protein
LRSLFPSDSHALILSLCPGSANVSI